MSAQYVRDHYPNTRSFKRGDRIKVDGRMGTLVSFPDQYLGVRFDGEKHTSRCHPTWRVERPAHHCTGCGNPRRPFVVDANCCTCCHDARGNQPGGRPTW